VFVCQKRLRLSSKVDECKPLGAGDGLKFYLGQWDSSQIGNAGSYHLCVAQRPEPTLECDLPVLGVLVRLTSFECLCSCDQIRESIMILLTMGLNSDHFSDHPFKTQSEFQNDQISLSNS
jgi:hypothetical protein